MMSSGRRSLPSRPGSVGGTIRARHEREASLTPTTPSQERRFTDGARTSSTVIGPGTRVQGDIVGDDAVEIHGALDGDCQTSAHCVVHEGGRVLGNLAAAAVVVAGEVEAGVLSADKVELRASARVVATIRTRVIAIRDGAFYEGLIEDADAPGGPALLRDRRRGPAAG